MERRLAAILAVDIVEYCRLMEADERGTLGRMQGRLKGLFEPRIAQYNGRIFKLMGDGLLAEFASVVDAVECAALLQQAVAASIDDAPAGQGIEVRMAVNLGDVIIDGDDRHGEGVNIAARLQKLAEPGGLIVSRAVYDQVRSKVALNFDDLGEMSLRNIVQPVKAYRALPSEQPGRADILTVTTSPNFASKWLVHRLGDFAESHPEVDLRISASLHHVDFAREGVDVAIRHGEGQWPGLHVTRLVSEELFPVCSPKMLRGRNALRAPQDLARYPLLHLNDRRNWQAWFDTAGLDITDGARGIVFNQASLAIDAAVDGQGIALARTALTAWDLRKGRLVRPFDLVLSVPYAYWIVCPRASADLPGVATFRQWLLEQAEADAAELSLIFQRQIGRPRPNAPRRQRS
jgi:class 3 adenylate cyclase